MKKPIKTKIATECIIRYLLSGLLIIPLLNGKAESYNRTISNSKGSLVSSKIDPPSFNLKTNSALSKSVSLADKKNEIKFIENKGQVTDQNFNPRPDVLFSGSSENLVFHLKRDGVSYQLSKADKGIVVNNISNNKKTVSNNTSYRVDVNWLNINKSVVIKKDLAEIDRSNYYTSDNTNGITGVLSYKQIIYEQIYQGVDLKWYENNGHLKYEYLVEAGVDYNQILMKFEGAESISVNSKGELVIKTPLGNLIEEAPLVIQKNNILNSKWVVSNNVARFAIDNLDSKSPYVIDPCVRTWASYYGGNSDEIMADCVTDAAGNVYLSGRTFSAFNIATVGAHQTIFGTNHDAFLVKFNSAGVRQWATYYGGNGYDDASSVCIDQNNNVYIAGATQFNNAAIATIGSHQSVFGGGNRDAFLVKFNSLGVRIWGTYYGGASDDEGIGCSTDFSGNVYLAGSTRSNAQIATAGAHQIALGGLGDGFIAKFNGAGVRQWGSYYGGVAVDWATCSNDPVSGEVILSGISGSNGGISSGGSHQPVLGGGFDCFLAKFNSTGIRQWGTYYGGTANDYSSPNSTCIDALGNIYLIGYGNSINGNSIATAGSYQSIFGGGASDIFLAKFNSVGLRQWGTYYGGAGDENYPGCATDACNNVYFTGYTSSVNSIATMGSHQPAYGGGLFDGLLAKFETNGSRLWATYYGGNLYDLGGACNIDVNGNIYLVGQSMTTVGNSIATVGSHQPAFGGGNWDCYIAKFTPTTPTITPTQTNPSVCSCNGSASVNIVNGEPPYSYYWSNSTSVLNTTVTSSSISGLCPGVYQVTVTSNCNHTDTVSFTLTGSAQTLTANFTTVNANCSSPNGSVTITSVTNGVPNYTIAEGTTTLAANVNTPHTISPVTVGSHTYTVTSANGCSTTFTANVLAGGTLPNLTVISPVSLTCNSNTVTLSASSTATGVVTYTWSGPGILSGSSTPTPVVNQPGNYTVTISEGACSNTAVVSVIANTTSPNISITQPSTLTCLTTSVTLIGNSTTSGVTYSWSPQNVNTNTAVATSAGNYTFMVTDTLSGCISTSVISVVQDTVVPNITATASNSLNCILNSSTLTASGLNSVFVWNGGSLSNAVNPAVVSAPGNYSVTATNPNNGCTTTSVVTVIQNTIVPTASVSSSGNLNCNITSVTLTGSSTTSGVTYSWSPNVIGSANLPTAIANSAATYTLIVTDPTNGCSSIATINITSVPMFTAQISVLNQINCFGGNNGALQLNVIGTGTAPFNITNINTLNNIGNIFSFPVNLTGLSAATYSILIIDSLGCSQTLFATINQPPALNISLNGNTTLCDGQSTTITSMVNGGTAPYSYAWSPTGGNTSMLVTSPVANTTFTLSVTDNNGCQSTANISIIVNPKPNASLINGSLVGCSPVCASFSLSQTQSVGYSYNWSFTNNQTGSITTSPLYYPELCFYDPGTYNAGLLITTSAGCTTSVNYNMLITVYPKPISEYSFTPEKINILEPEVHFTNLSSGATSYAWYNVNTWFSDQTNPSYTFQDPGKFLVTLIASNGQCSDTISKYIVIEEEFSIYIPNTFTPNGDGLNDFFYPVMSGYSGKDYSFSIFDRWGELLYKSANPNETQWNGFYKNELCKNDIYIWKLNITNSKGKANEFTGHVTLLK